MKVTEDRKYGRLEDIGEQCDQPSSDKDIDSVVDIEIEVLLFSTYQRSQLSCIFTTEQFPHSQRGRPTSRRLLARATICIMFGSTGRSFQSNKISTIYNDL
jgi:hypothetical protein